MDKKFWLKKAIQSILSQNKSDVEKVEEIVNMLESLKYEYKSVLFASLKSDHYNTLDTEKLNVLGKEGWELICITGGECVFKREVGVR